MDNLLHIVTFEIPLPSDHDSAMDTFSMIRTLKEEGIHIHLHCFGVKDETHETLMQYCHQVNYYEETNIFERFSKKIPACIKYSGTLQDDLLKDNEPILVEDIRATGFIDKEQINKGRIFLRHHIVEYRFFSSQADCSLAPIEKIYYKRESALLKGYTRRISHLVNKIWTATEDDSKSLRDDLKITNTETIGSFVPKEWEVKCQQGKGCCCLYHGDLNIPSNEAAVIWLIKEVFSKIAIPFLIAGKGPSLRLKYLTGQNPNICLIENPSPQELQDLISKAHIHVLPAVIKTGICLNLINSLYNGRHCLVNTELAKDSALAALLETADNADQFINSLQHLFNRPFSVPEKEMRHILLSERFNNQQKALQLIKTLFPTTETNSEIGKSEKEATLNALKRQEQHVNSFQARP